MFIQIVLCHTFQSYYYFSPHSIHLFQTRLFLKSLLILILIFHVPNNTYTAYFNNNNHFFLRLQLRKTNNHVLKIEL